MSRGFDAASWMAFSVISWNTMRRTGIFGLELLEEVPGDRLPLSVLISREVELVDVLEALLEKPHLFL